MVKKLNLKISGGVSDNESAFREWTKSYRQSSNVIDRRGPEFEDERNDIVINDFKGKIQKRIDRVERIPESTTRKVDAEEAVRKTHFERN